MDGLLLERWRRPGMSRCYSGVLYSGQNPPQLFVRRGNLPSTDDPSSRKWSSFTLPLREPAHLPPLFDIARFLTSSLTFMSHLSCVSVHLDGRVLIRVSKDSPGAPSVGPAKSGGKSTVPFSKEVSVRGLRTTTPKGLMAVASVRKNSTSSAV